MTFKKGESGNAAGRPKGRKNKSTVLRSKYGALVWEKLFELAMDGDPVALRLIADRVIPKLKPQYQTVCLPETANAKEFCEFVLRELAAGHMAPDVARSLVETIAAYAAVTDLADVMERIAELESGEFDRILAKRIPNPPAGTYGTEPKRKIKRVRFNK